jgi:hypothetical protein
VVKVATGLRRDRTHAGVGVGSSEQQVRVRERARCGYSARDNRIVNSYFCLAGRGQRQVVFVITGECVRPGIRPCTRFRLVVYEVIVATPTLMQQLRFKQL